MKSHATQSVLAGTTALVAVLLLSTSAAEAVVIGSATLEADGRYLYNYTLSNDNPDGFLTNWSLDHGIATPDWSLTDVVTPSGWAVDWLVSYPDMDFLADFGSELGSGLLLSGFSFLSSYAPALVTYYEFGYAGDFSDFGSVGSVIGPALSTAVPDSWHPLLAPLTFLLCLSFHAWNRSRPPGVTAKQQG